MPDDRTEIGALWHASWHRSHAVLLPPEVVAFRGPAFFERRSHAILQQTQIAERNGVLVGFVAWAGDEVDELFVAEAESGRGTGAALLSWAEAALAQQGVERAVLSCAIGNGRAERFYTKHGWRRDHVSLNVLESVAGFVRVDVLTMAKRVLGGQDGADALSGAAGQRAILPRAPIQALRIAHAGDRRRSCQPAGEANRMRGAANWQRAACNASTRASLAR